MARSCGEAGPRVICVSWSSTLLEALVANEPRWWDVEGDDGETAISLEAAYRHLGRLWHGPDSCQAPTGR